MSPTNVGPSALAENLFFCTDWLNRESALLDDQRLRDWFDLLHPELEYRVPVRITRERENGAGFSELAFHLDENYESMEVRVDRFLTDFAWAEDPPSRTRRIVSNVRVEAAESGSYEVRSNFLLYRGRLDAAEADLLAGERRDLLLSDEGAFKLRKREVRLDHSTIPSKNLGLFF